MAHNLNGEPDLDHFIISEVYFILIILNYKIFLKKVKLIDIVICYVEPLNGRIITYENFLRSK